jgi:hypothetical protein
VRLVLTPARWAASSAVLAVVLSGAIWALPATIRGVVELPRERWPYEAAACVLGSLLVLALLAGEDSRLTRELRTARAGSHVARQTLLRRRRSAPWYARMVSSTLGLAAVHLAEGDAESARAAFHANSFSMSFGRLRDLRAVVNADLLRGIGAESTLGDAIRALYNMAPLPNLEAERYRVHVLVKALLEQADGATARDLAHDLAASTDDELRVYAVWLRAWFELEDLPAPAEGDVRKALLLARSHGAEDLVGRLEAQLAGARAEP